MTIRPYRPDEVRALRIRSRRVASSVVTGEVRAGARTSHGLELSDFREYEPGDDVSRIDWNVTARAGRPWVRLYVEERGLKVLVLTDISRSAPRLLLDLANRLLSAAAYAGHRVGLLLFNDRLRKCAELTGGARELPHLIRQLETEWPEEGLTNVSAALNYAAAIPRRTLIYLLSDFMCDDFTTALLRCAHRHEVVAIGCEQETALPPAGLARVRDPETGRTQIIDTSIAELRAAPRLRRERNAETFRKAGVDVLILPSAADSMSDLTDFLRTR